MAERTGCRNGPSDYSKFHHDRFGQNFYMTDVDVVEYEMVDGKLKILALMEIIMCRKKPEYPNNELSEAYWNATMEYSARKQEVVSQLARSHGVPAYIVVHNEAMTEFWVKDLLNKQEPRKQFNQAAYIEFVKAVRKGRITTQ